MSRDTKKAYAIALLATGDEIVEGGILNTNSKNIAAHLIDTGFTIGMHMVVSDNVEEIENAVRFLLQAHTAIIITGGLGPTSDDLTRFALSKVMNQPLIFNDAAWENIKTRLAKFNIAHPPESNKQQALFPAEAVILPNINGTAAACYAWLDNKLLFMLPGPPNECLPILTKYVIPTCLKNNWHETMYRHSWFLLGVSEGKIAEELDTLLFDLDCTTGYRIAYPYVECKIKSDNHASFLRACALIQKHIQAFIIADGKMTASDYLKTQLIAQPIELNIHDEVTGGLLETLLRSPDTAQSIYFAKPPTKQINIRLSGLNNYWANESATYDTAIEISIDNVSQTYHKLDRIPLRGNMVVRYAAEWACRHIVKCLYEQDKLKTDV
jgi:nicotinamide-nucleotide amidase